MPGLVPGIHVLSSKQGVDGRDKPGHDGGGSIPHSAEPVIGRRFAPTRWLHAGYELFSERPR